MSALKFITAAAILTVPVLLASAPAEAITARQYASQGRNFYATSKGVPEGYYPQQQGYDDEQAGYRPEGYQYRGRYFGDY